MRFLCDVHTSLKVKKFLLSKGHFCVHINEILEGDKTGDTIIGTFCNKEDLILITKGEDFIDSYLLKHLPAKLLKINLGNISTKKLIVLLNETLPVLETVKTRTYFLVEIHKNKIQIFEDLNL